MMTTVLCNYFHIYRQDRDKNILLIHFNDMLAVLKKIFFSLKNLIFYLKKEFDFRIFLKALDSLGN
jgi:hypothetical protein